MATATKAFINGNDDLNILFLGQTGVGKTTFINAFSNYLAYNTLESAINGTMVIPIPASFSTSVPTKDGNRYQTVTVDVGQPDQNENHRAIGESSTLGCRAYIFNIGARKLRLIDAPGIGDTRGVIQDKQNFEHILAFISQYHHLNGICILLKPNEEKLNILLRFCIKELINHLHTNARKNIMFVFTNIRSSCFKLGRTHPLLIELLQELRSSSGVDVPLIRDNMFLFDNEGFRYLATCKRKEFGYTDDDKTDFSRSWNVSVKEVSRLVARLVANPKHQIKDTISLNQVQQLIHILARPVGEVVTLNQQNITLAMDHRIKLQNGKQSTMVQKSAKVVKLSHPRTVCSADKCRRAIVVEGTIDIEYFQHCHPHCQLTGVQQEVIGHQSLQECDAINKKTGLCKHCGCEWKKHMHITYEFHKFVVHPDMQTPPAAKASSMSLSSLSSALPTSSATSLNYTDAHIAELKSEHESIIRICARLSLFLQANAMIPFNDDILEYMKHFLTKEQDKKRAGEPNDDIIRGLEETMRHYEYEMKLYKQTVTGTPSATQTPATIEEIFDLVKTLYGLPINGEHIRNQVEVLKHGRTDLMTTREHVVELPAIAATSTVMIQLQGLTQITK